MTKIEELRRMLGEDPNTAASLVARVAALCLTAKEDGQVLAGGLTCSIAYDVLEYGLGEGWFWALDDPAQERVHLLIADSPRSLAKMIALRQLRDRLEEGVIPDEALVAGILSDVADKIDLANKLPGPAADSE